MCVCVQCSLCQEESKLPDAYADAAVRLELAELNRDFVDFELSTGTAMSTRAHKTEMLFSDEPAVPAVLFVVDVTGDKAYLDALKSGLLAAMEGTKPLWIELLNCC